MVNRSGANLALLLLGGFRSLANAATEELARRGYEDFRPVHDFAMRAIAAGADSASELGRRLSVSKQAAAKTISVLEDRGYIEREPDASDARRKHLKATSLGFKVLQTGEAIFDELRSQWAEQIGADQLEVIEKLLTERLNVLPNGLINPGWLEQDDARSHIS
jgi:DNA-binding MarR family transcriptional regulator